MKRLMIFAVSATIAAALAGAASAAPFGLQVAACAHELGAREAAPAVTCTHGGMTMSFENFGAMVEHMRAMH